MDLLVLNTFTCTAEFTQVAAIEALQDSTNAVDAMVAEYRKRRDLFVTKLNAIPGFRCQSPDGAFYAWVNIEDTGLPAEEVARVLLEEAGVAGIAGAAFGPAGKNYLRFSLVSARNLLEEALERIERVSHAGAPRFALTQIRIAALCQFRGQGFDQAGILNTSKFGA